MLQSITEARIKGGCLEIVDLPFSDAKEVKVFVLPKVQLLQFFYELEN